MLKQPEKTAKKAARKRPGQTAINPLLVAEWATPFGIAPFWRIEPQHYAPAFKTALDQHLAEVKEIAENPTRPSFANTLKALEQSGRLLARVADVFFNLTGADTNEQLQAVERNVAPVLAAHDSAVYLNAKLFARIEDLFRRRQKLKLNDEEARLLDRTYTAFIRAGAKLNTKSKKRVAAINARLAMLVTRFGQNVLADEQSWHMLLKTPADLAGLPGGVVSAAQRAAVALGYPDQHAITLSRSSVESFLQFSANRNLREGAFKAWVSRGENDGPTDNRGIVAEVMALRAELAKLMGYETYADYALDDTMARTPGAARVLLNQVWDAAIGQVEREREALQARARQDGENFELAAWDWRYYAEKERQARFDLDDNELRLYFDLERMIEAAFDTASKLFGLAFRERCDIPTYHPDVRAWEAVAADGSHVGLFLGDYFARPSKRSGAWMSNYRTQQKLVRPSSPIIVNVMNFARGAENSPTLLSFDDARTLFHEFGHGLHGLLSDVTYPALSGTNVSRDFVELPSQLFEHWLSQPKVLKKFALHCQTKNPIPDELLKRLFAARNFNQGFATVEFTASALVDLELHELRECAELDVGRIEQALLHRIGMPAEISMRHRTPHFLHIMGGYAAGYYSYMWSEVMDADAFSAFEETGDVFDPATAQRLKTYIYSAGNLRDPHDAYVAFRGRPPTVDGLLKKRGFAAASG